MSRTTSPDATTWFAGLALALAGVAALMSALAGFGAFANGGVAEPGEAALGELADDGAVADPNADVAALVASSATAMAAVTSVEFRLEREGAPIFIDQFERIALDSLRGQFTVPTRAQAQLEVTVEESLATRLAAVAIDDQVWISNPVTGDFETLPDGYDIDPSRFFDPENGWGPLLASLADVELVGVESRGGERYHVRGTAPAAQVREITVGLVRDQDVSVDLWLHPATSLVTSAEFETTTSGADRPTTWILELSRYGDTFLIDPPTNLRTAAGSA